MVVTGNPLKQTLSDAFGFDSFRLGQEPAITRLLDGKSVLAIFPTGSGKSLCYQLPALLMDGLTLVISPLIALMKDQIDFLQSRGVAAARLDSSVEFEESRQAYRDLAAGRLKLLYIAPERLANERFLQMLRRLPITMMAVDEAHCISEWGHNFRPDYLKLANLARELRIGRVLALTATATPSVAADIARAFAIAADDIVHTGFYRPNLSMCMTPVGHEDRRRLLLGRIQARKRGPSIVYVTLQETAEQVAGYLADHGLPARPYHAGMESEARHEVQDWFMASADAIVVATIAFGMGIDKRDIRYIYHYNLPKTLENYAQEIGRAGRDGQDSTCELLACADDRIILENFTYGDTPTPEAVRAALDEVLGQGAVFDISTYELSQKHDIRPLVLDTLLTYLELLGVMESTGMFYTEYLFQPLRDSQEILARFDAPRAEFLRQILQRAVKRKTWFALDLHQIAAQIGQKRERLVSAVNYLEEQGDVLLKVAGVRQGYRLKQEHADRQSLADIITGRFLKREDRDIQRVAQVVDFASHQGCYTRILLAYFGEERQADCGHCGWCQGQRPARIDAAPPQNLTSDDQQLIATVRGEGHAALASPRQLARFLCGISSPSASKAKLTRHEAFGALGHVPFKFVLGRVG